MKKKKIEKNNKKYMAQKVSKRFGISGIRYLAELGTNNFSLVMFECKHSDSEK